MSLQRISARVPVGVLILLLVALPAVGDELEEQAKKIEGKLMAPCCRANTVAEHESGAAYEMRREIRAMLAAGRTQREILDHYVERYGSQILSAPEARGFGLTAYLLPFVMLIGGVVLIIFAVRRWSRMRVASSPSFETPEIDPEHLARLQRDLRQLD